MSRNKRIAYRGCLLALALALSYLESLIPVFYGIPGLRIGLANVVTVYALYQLPLPDVCFIAGGRVVLSAILFGNVTVMIYSLAGALLSLAVMLLAKPLPWLSSMGVSILGGVFHNIGQTLVACFLLSSGGLLSILAVLLPVGAVTGTLVGILAGILIRKVPIGEWREKPEIQGDEKSKI